MIISEIMGRIYKTTLLIACLHTVISQFTSPYTVLDPGGSFDIQNSPNQLEKASGVNTLIIPGDLVLDVPATSTIIDRYTCTDYAMLFTVSDPVGNPNTVTLEIQLPGAVTTSDKPECTVNWADGVTEGPVKLGVYPISMVCTDKHNANKNNSCPENNSECVTTADFLDNVYTQFQTSMKFFTTEAVMIKSYMEFTSFSCGTPTITWRVINVNNALLTPISNFSQPLTSVFKLEPGFLEPGEYFVSLEVLFTAQSLDHWSEDLIIIQIVLPELVTHIQGGEFVDVTHGGYIFIDASLSWDPSMLHPSVAAMPMNASWQFAHFPVSPTLYNLHLFLKEFPDASLPAGSTTYQIGFGTEYILKINTSSFPVDTYAAVMFTLSRGDRISSAMQMIRFIANAVPVSIVCVYNCHVGRERLYYYDKVELDLEHPDGLDTSTFSYTWKIMKWNPLASPIVFPYLGAPEAVIETGLETASISITAYTLYQGTTYRILATVSAAGYSETTVEFIRTVNYIPYGGTCSLNSLEVTSARDWLTLSCSGWKGNDNRKIYNSAVDINPVLTYTVRQRTTGALVEEEPILQTRSQRAHMIMKVGDIANTYSTSLFIQVSDLFKNYREIELTVKSKPAFNASLVTPDQAGAALIKSYTEVDYPFDEDQLQKMGKSDMIISLISAVCSNIHLVSLKQWTPPVPRVLNAGGSILDLSPAGNEDVGTLNDVSAAANNETIDPATLAIQEVLLNMTKLLREVVDRDLVSGTRSGDKMFTSIITNAFTNIAGKPEFVDTEAKRNLIYLGEIVGGDALTLPNTTEDVSAQIESTSGEIYYMFQAVVGAAVPDELRQIRSVRNLLSGRTQAKDAAIMATDLAKDIQEKLKLCATCNNHGSTKTKQLVQNNAASVMTTELLSTDTSKFRLDGLRDASSSDTESISVSAYEFNENVYMYDNDGVSSLVTSNVLRIDVKTPEKRITPGFMTFEQSVLTPEAELVTPHVDDEDASEFMYHEFIYQSATDNMCLIILPLGAYQFTQYTLYIKFSGPPSLIDYDIKFVVEHEHNWQTCILPEQMKGNTGSLNLAVSVPETIRNFQYNLTIITVGCLTWEEAATKWHSDKCSLEWFPDQNKITCYCREVTDMVFANSFVVAPNSIDFSSVFLRFSPLNQAAVMATLIGIFLIYVVAVIFLLRLDRRDKLRWGITPLRDNMMFHAHYYIIKVFTGMRRGSGTRSRIAFTLTGFKAGTRPRELFDGVREEFSTGGVMSFFMATKVHLGDLQHLYIWHDNSGGAWYLNQVLVYDIENQTTYTFVAERWLSLETTIDAKLPSCPKGRPIQFETRFFYQTRDRLSESHMWVSILYRPQFSTFTRVQRASCALVYIFLTMIANAMYFNPNPEYASAPLIQAGPLRFTPQQIFISIVCAVMTTPVVMLLIFLFKRTRRKPSDSKSSCRSNICKCSPLPGCLSRCICCTRRNKDQTDYEKSLKAKSLTSEIPEFGVGCYLPYWCIYFAWLLVFVGTVVPAFFLLLYSMEWGKQKSEEWLTTLFMSLLESMLCVDPILVICMSLVLALIIRTNKDVSNIDVSAMIENYKRVMGEDEDSLNSSVKILKSIKEEYKTFENDPIQISPPLHGYTLAQATKKHHQHVQLGTIVKDIFLNMFFMCIIFSICYSNRDDRSYLHYSEIVNNIVSPTKLPHFNKIKTPGDLYTWMNVSVIPHLFPEFDMNGAPLHWSLRQFRTGYHDLRLGPPRLRQLRTKNGTCNIPYIGRVKCYGEYSMLDEESDNQCIGWTPNNCGLVETVFNVSTEAWTYKNAIDVWGLPLPGFYTTYGGGGYICPLDVSRNVSISIINELFKNLWMDRQTRAVVLEFTLYNGATNIFIYNSFLVEFPQTGGAFTSYSLYPVRVYNHLGAIGTYTLICEIIFVFYLASLLVKICIRFYQQRCSYFKQFWQNYELIILITGITAIVVYAIRLGLTYVTINRFKEDKKLYVNFSHIVLWDQILVAFLGSLAFMSTLRILEIFATSKKVDAVVRIFRDCGKDLFWYGLFFLYIFFGFCFLGVLLFGAQLLAYMNIYHCMGTLFIALIGKSQFTEINETQPVLAKIFFTLYIFFVVFFILTIFLSILGASIDKTIHNTREDKTDDLIELIMRKICSLFKTPGGKMKDNQGIRMRDKEQRTTLTEADKLTISFYKDQHPIQPRFLFRKNQRNARSNMGNQPIVSRNIVCSS